MGPWEDTPDFPKPPQFERNSQTEGLVKFPGAHLPGGPVKRFTEALHQAALESSRRQLTQASLC